MAPTGTNAIVIYSDPRCPWAHVAVRRLLAAVERRGVGSELHVDHRWFPLGDDVMPSDPDALDRMLGPVRGMEPEAGWHDWSSAGGTFPVSSEPAAAWIEAAKRQGPAVSTALDRELRAALFSQGRDISDDSVLAEVAAGVEGLCVEAVRHEVDSGRPATELARHAELAESDLVPVSPTIVLSDSTAWANPGVELHTEDGVPVVDGDDPAVYDEIIDAFLAQRHYD